MSTLYDVVISGGGPIGLLLACELALSHVSVLVLERDTSHSSPMKVSPLGRRGLNTPSVESFYRRGLLSKISASVSKPEFFRKTEGFQFAGHFAGMMLNANKLDLDRWKYRLPGPALMPIPTTLEEVLTALTERAESLGVTILMGREVTEIIAEDEHSVTVEATETATGEAGEAREKQSFRGKWLVGCDGGRSAIRKCANFSFVGTEAQFTGYAIQCTLSPPSLLKPGFYPSKGGMYIVAPGSIYLLDFDGGAFDRTREITREHLQGVLERATGRSDVRIEEVYRASAFTDRAKQATGYRKGRVLLAGDAAHIHSPLGAQGLNVGLGDAMNLGWKLASTIRQESALSPAAAAAVADLTLLDTYEKERHPVAAWVLEWTRAQVATLVPDLYGKAMQTLIRDFIDTTDGTNLFIDRVWGLSQRYTLGDDEANKHPLVGCSVPDFEMLDSSRLGSKIEAARGRGLFVDFDFDDKVQADELKGLVVGGEREEKGMYEDRVDYVGVGAKDRRGIRAVLVRPDGVVAWVAEENAEPDVGAAKVALELWFGF